RAAARGAWGPCPRTRSSHTAAPAPAGTAAIRGSGHGREPRSRAAAGGTSRWGTCRFRYGRSRGTPRRARRRPRRLDDRLLLRAAAVMVEEPTEVGAPIQRYQPAVDVGAFQGTRPQAPHRGVAQPEGARAPEPVGVPAPQVVV